jgi:hypothetical protein
MRSIGQRESSAARRGESIDFASCEQNAAARSRTLPRADVVVARRAYDRADRMKSPTDKQRARRSSFLRLFIGAETRAALAPRSIPRGSFPFPAPVVSGYVGYALVKKR